MADTTIESTKYNANVADVETDLNAPRPIVAGGTGATNAADAATNLGVVTGKTAIVYTEAEKTQARANVAAAPFDALAYNGMQVNGSMEVSQERGATTTTTTGYICDGWVTYRTGTMIMTSAKGTSGLPGIPGLLYSFCTNIQASLGVNDNIIMLQYIEGYRISRLAWGTANPQPITLGFWTAHSTPGTYSICIRNSPFTHSYTTSYTQNVADASEYKTITIPGPAVGTWASDNSVGMQIIFMLGAGSNSITPSPNTWGTNPATAVAGQVNLAAVLSSTFRLTGLVVLPGTQAPTAAQSPLIMRPYDQELMTCQRYLQKLTFSGTGINIGASGVAYGTTRAAVSGMFITPTRVTPTMLFNSLRLSDVYSASQAVTAMTIISNNTQTFTLDATVASGLTTGRWVQLEGVGTTGYVQFDARL